MFNVLPLDKNEPRAMKRGVDCGTGVFFLGFFFVPVFYFQLSADLH